MIWASAHTSFIWSYQFSPRQAPLEKNKKRNFECAIEKWWQSSLCFPIVKMASGRLLQAFILVFCMELVFGITSPNSTEAASKIGKQKSKRTDFTRTLLCNRKYCDSVDCCFASVNVAKIRKWFLEEKNILNIFAHNFILDKKGLRFKFLT